MLCRRLSRYPRAQQPSKFRVTWSASLIHWSVVVWCATKPNRLAFSKFLSSVCFWIFLKISFSDSLPVMDKRLIGRKFGGNLESLPDFGRVMIFASLQSAGKWPSRRQWLNICVECTRGLVGRCRRHSFGMPSKPRVFPNFKDCISFETSQGRELTGMSSSTLVQSQSYFTIGDLPSISSSWHQVPWGPRPDFSTEPLRS
jgi:hypothetical protein